MNSTSNSSNASYFYYDLDFWLPQFASTWALDSIYLFVITPLALIGMFLNIFTFILLTKKEFHKNKIYSFFKWIALNSALMNLVESGLFSCSTYRYFDFSNSYESNSTGLMFFCLYTTHATYSEVAWTFCSAWKDAQYSSTSSSVCLLTRSKTFV